MRRLILAVAPLAAGLIAPPALLPAQVREASAEAVTAAAAYDKLLSEFTAAQRAFAEANREARARGEAIEGVLPFDTFLPMFQQAAEQHAGTEGALPFLLWIVTSGSGNPEAAGAALDAIADSHADSPQLARLATLLPRLARTAGEQRVAALQQLLLESPHPAVRAEILFARGNETVGRMRRESVTDEERAATVAGLRQVVELVPETPLAERAARALFEVENLQVGMVAPDIVAEDIDGVEFKLSDYRGKVILLDFWGDW